MPCAESDLRRTVLANGLTVLSESMPGVRSVALGAWVRAASLHESADKMGVSHMLEHMVFKGTPTRSAKELALALEVLGGSLDAYTSREHTSYQAKVLDEHLSQAADVLGDLIFRPTLKGADLALEKKVVLEEINTVDDTPDDLVFELHNAQMWGNHPYGYQIRRRRRERRRRSSAARRRRWQRSRGRPPRRWWRESARAGNGRRSDKRTDRSQHGISSHGSTKWTDRTLGAHAGSTVGCFRGLGARRIAA